MLFINFGIDVAVHYQKIGPAVVVEIKEHRSPAQILRMQTKPGRKSYIVKCAVPVISIERGSVVGKVRAKNIKPAVAIEVGDRASHAGLGAPTFIKSRVPLHIGGRLYSIVLV